MNRRSMVLFAAAATLAVSLAVGQTLEQRQATFFMGRVKYSNNDGNDCPGVGRNMAKIVSQVSTIHIQDEKKVAFTEAALFETPFLFMNGHNDFVLSEADLENLRIYFQHGGFLFTSGCCTNAAFPLAWRRELARVFPGEQVKSLPYDHLIYRSFYKMERIRCLHNNREIFVEGLFWQDRLVAVICEEGLCCAFAENNRCNVGRGMSPEDGKQLALNIAVYAMTH